MKTPVWVQRTILIAAAALVLVIASVLGVIVAASGWVSDLRAHGGARGAIRRRWKWWTRVSLVTKFAIGLFLASVAITYRFDNYTPALWIPSLVCNLFTTALAIYFINRVVVAREHRQRDAAMSDIPQLIWTRAHVWGHNVGARLKNDPDAALAMVEENAHQLRDFAAFIDRSVTVYGGVLDYPIVKTLDEMSAGATQLASFKRSGDRMLDLHVVYAGMFHLVRGYEYLRKRFPIEGSEGLFEMPARFLGEFEQKYRIQFPQSTFSPLLDENKAVGEALRK